MILAAAAEDLPRLVALEHALFGVDAWAEAAVRAELSGPGATGFVATDDPGSVVGYILTRVVGDTADLQRIGVDPAHRRTGVASALLAEAMRDGAARGARRMLLEVADGNAGAVAFYRGHGFLTLARRRRYYRDGSDALVMQRPLLAADG